VPTAHLQERGVVRVRGADARAFLDNLVTCDIDQVTPERARFGALLTPQGKILFDFIAAQAPAEVDGGYYLDCRAAFSADLAKRLAFYKLRARVDVEDLTGRLAVVAGWGGAPRAPDDVGLVYEDPRPAALGWRAIVALGDAQEFAGADAEAYHAHRIALGVPDGGRDFLFGDAFPHEALMDQLAGVDFDKGCYVGQEVVSRMQHRGTARTRIVSLAYEQDIVAELAAEVTAGGRPLGATGSGAKGRGLAMIRLDRAADALAAGERILAGGMPARLDKPAWIRFAYPGEASA